MFIRNDDLWFCVDCMLMHANGENDSIDVDVWERNVAREWPDPELRQGFAMNTGACDDGCSHEHSDACHDDGCDHECDSGHEEFSWSQCECCGVRIAGARHRFVVLVRPERMAAEIAKRHFRMSSKYPDIAAESRDDHKGHPQYDTLCVLLDRYLEGGPESLPTNVRSSV